MAIRSPIIGLLGRPNVGKSTLFNRIMGGQLAVVEDIPGVTRDRNYAYAKKHSIPFYIVDTGGFEEAPEDEMSKLVVEQTLVAVQEADAIIVLFDGDAGVQPGDQDVVNLVRRSNKKTYFVVNKCDGKEQEWKVGDFYSLGVDQLYSLSALHGQGVNTLVEKVLTELPNYKSLLESAQSIKEKEIQAELAVEKEIQDLGAAIDWQEDEDKVEVEDQIKMVVHGESPGKLEARDPEFAPVFIPGLDQEADQQQHAQEQYTRTHRLRETQDLSLVFGSEEAEQAFDARFGKHSAEISDVAEAKEVIPEIDLIRVAIIGRPNVGKSTLVNTLTGEKRAITSSIAGTTRDSLDLLIKRDGQEYLIVDTAGLRKQSKISEAIEKYSTLRSLRALSQSDVAVVLLDAIEGPTDQDAKIVGLAHEEGKAIVLVVNKWDALEKSHTTVHEFTRRVRDTFKFAPYAPIIFASALSGRRCPNIIEAAKQVAQQRLRRIPTARLNQVIHRTMSRLNPPSYRGQAIKLFFATQISVAPPRFVLFFNHPKHVHFSILRALKNALREEFKFSGIDLKLITRKR